MNNPIVQAIASVALCATIVYGLYVTENANCLWAFFFLSLIW